MLATTAGIYVCESCGLRFMPPPLPGEDGISLLARAASHSTMPCPSCNGRGVSIVPQKLSKLLYQCPGGHYLYLEAGEYKCEDPDCKMIGSKLIQIDSPPAGLFEMRFRCSNASCRWVELKVARVDDIFTCRMCGDMMRSCRIGQRLT